MLKFEQEKSNQYINFRIEQINSKRLQIKSLLFGLEQTFTYKGHKGQVILNSIENKEKNLNITIDQKTIHFWNQHQTHQRPVVVKMIDIVKSHCSVVTIAYSPKYKLYLIVTSDFKFIFMNELNIVLKPLLDMSLIRLVNQVVFYDEKDLLITGGINGVFIYKFDYQGKYKPSLAAKVDPNGTYIKIQLINKKEVENMLIWCKGLKIDKKANIIITWDWKDVSINQLSHNGGLVCQYKELCQVEEKILDVLVFNDYRYFVTATDEGNIYVFKYLTTGKVETTRRLIHSFQGHFQAITSICQIEKQPHLLLSVSFDCSARVWSLDNFQHQYTFELPSGLNFIKIKEGGKEIVAGSIDQIQIYNLHMILENYTPTDCTVSLIQPIYLSLKEKVQCKPAFTVSLCDDNSAFVKTTLINAQEQKTNIYPPPGSDVIKSINFSIRLNRLIVILTNSSTCFYKKQKDTALLESILEPKEILDSENKKAILQDVTCMEIFQTNKKKDIRCFDSDVLNHVLHIFSLITALACPYPNQEFLAIGLSKGCVILLHTRQIRQVFLRLTVHREAIKLIKYLPELKLFLTTCSDNYFKIWRCHLPTRKAQILIDLKVKKSIQDILVLNNADNKVQERFLVIFTTGESELFEFDQNQNALFWIESEKAREHDTKLTGYDFNSHLQIIVTSDQSGVLRIWNFNKKFIREIIFPTKIDSVCFLNCQGDLLVSHAKRLSYINFVTYWTKTFDYFGITKSREDSNLNQKAKEDQSMFFEDPDFVIETEQPRRVQIENDDQIRQILSGKFQKLTESKTELSITQNLSEIKSNLMLERRQSSLFQQNQSQKQPIQQKISDRQIKQNKISPPKMLEQIRKQNTTENINPIKEAFTMQSLSQVDHKFNSSQNLIEEIEDDSAMTLAQRKTLFAKKMKILSPHNVPALPKNQGLPKVGLIQPLPGMSYLSTSAAYYEMIAQRQKQNKTVPPKQTRRNITESRITSNIMQFNQPTTLIDNNFMEVSCDYQTSVSQSKYQLSGLRVGSLYSQQPLPLEYLLNSDFSYISSQIMNQRIQRQQQEVQGAIFGQFQQNISANVEQQRQSRNRKLRSQQKTASFVQSNQQATKKPNLLINNLDQQQKQIIEIQSADISEYQRRHTVIPASVRAQFSLQFQNDNLRQQDFEDTITMRNRPVLRQIVNTGQLKNQNGTKFKIKSDKFQLHQDNIQTGSQNSQIQIQAKDSHEKLDDQYINSGAVTAVNIFSLPNTAVDQIKPLTQTEKYYKSGGSVINANTDFASADFGVISQNQIMSDPQQNELEYLNEFSHRNEKMNKTMQNEISHL